MTTTFTWPGVLHLVLDLLRDIVRKDDSRSFVDLVGNDHDANLTTSLHGVRALDAFVGIGDFLELLEALDVALEAFFASPGASGRNGVGRLNQDIENAVGLDVGMMGLDSVHDFRLFPETTSKVGADDGMRTFDFVVDCLAEVVEQTCTLGGNRVETELGGHDAAEIGHLERVIQDVLPERRAEAQATERTDKLRMQVMNAHVEGSLLSSLLNLLVYLLFRFGIHLLDTRRMDTAVCDEVLHGDATDFAANGVEARDGDALGGVVNQKIDSGELLERTDISAFASDDAALEVVRRDMDGLHRCFSGMIGSDALDGKAQNLARLFVGLELRALFSLADDGGTFVGNLVAKTVEKLSLRLVGSHAGNTLELNVDLLHSAFEVALATLDLSLHGRELMLASIEGLDTAIEGFLALVDAVLSVANLAHTLFVFGLSLLLHLEDFVFRFDDRFATQRFSLAFRIADKLLSLFSGLFARSVDEVAGDNETDGDANNGDDDKP